ncbi:hypothetical protein V1477_017008 [Vespula maculifrons]|uniref:Uncharacterized protein n=1 Tax=Vespula maculifrons TaxID=7453 RepID=A0ABD2B4T2_VESMC
MERPLLSAYRCKMWIFFDGSSTQTLYRRFILACICIYGFAIVKVQWDLFIIDNFRFSFFYLHFIVVRTSLIGRNIDSERRHAFRIVTDIAMAENVDGKPMETSSGIIDR